MGEGKGGAWERVREGMGEGEGGAWERVREGHGKHRAELCWLPREVIRHVSCILPRPQAYLLKKEFEVGRRGGAMDT